MLPAKFGLIWTRSFRGEDFFSIDQSETRIALGSHICWPSSFRGEDFFNIRQSETRIALGSHICWQNGTK